jgi:hypothetical protein
VTSRNGFLAGVALGAAVGLASSLANASTLPAARFAGYVLNAGWTWAAVAVAAGWFVGTRARGAGAGVLALFTTTTAYYGMDSVLRGESLSLYWGEMRGWWLVSILFGSLLGVVGASIRRPGPAGRLAGLVVPVGAAVEMAWIPRWGGALHPDPVLQLVRIAVWIAAGVAVVVWLRAPSRPRPAERASRADPTV